MATFSSFVSALADELKSQTTAILCGAGISRHSGLPVVDQLVPFVLETLDVPEDSRRTIATSGLPFEAFVETVREVCDIDLLLDIFSLGEPNTNHVLLAKLVKQGFLKTLCTTNFDTLIEKAFEAEGLHRGNGYQVFSKETTSMLFHGTAASRASSRSTAASRTRTVSPLPCSRSRREGSRHPGRA
jgi:hypothetical protein